ncbi:MAG: hypothetical protein CMP39_02120 [Rickettsiales bacterium]|nr:hypothetical protein [Rickettsiales bacterium]
MKKLLALKKELPEDLEFKIKQLPEYKNLLIALKNKTFDSLMMLKKRHSILESLRILQDKIEQDLSPNIIHIYDCDKINKTIIGTSPSNYSYTKVSLYENKHLSLFLFFPKNDISVTSPHSHYTTKSKTYLSNQSWEYEIPIIIDESSKTITLKHDKNSLELSDHIVFFSKLKLKEETLYQILKTDLLPEITKVGYSISNIDN